MKEEQLLGIGSLDEATQLPEEFAELKIRLLERQEREENALDEADDMSEANG